MGGNEEEEGVLKLVHPGRHVEYHRKPIIAAEVLKKNPRHSVTRPDVFEYPWIVVRPESMLNLGRVFYIVPNRTIYKLIKAKGYSIEPSSEQNHSPKDYRQRKILEQTSPNKSSAGTTPKHEDYCQSDWQQFQPTCEQDQYYGDQSFNVPRFESPAAVITKYQSAYQEFKQMSETDKATAVMKHDEDEDNDDDAQRTECKVVTVLKPCLRKPGSARNLLQLKVSFSLPTNSEEELCKSMDISPLKIE